MADIFKQFDAYSLKARVFPALIAGLPIMAFLFVIVPWDRLGLPQTIVVSMGLVLIYAFSDLARQRGKVIQVKIESGETTDQWHRGNSDIPEISKDRFRNYVANQLNQVAPTAEDEKENTKAANDFYRSAGVWLRDHTRDANEFPILFSENTTYGFRRNLLGLKPVSLTFNAMVFFLCVAILHFRPAYFSAQQQMDEKLVVVISASILHSAYMIFAVNKGTVLDASMAYGRQLILSCDTLIKASNNKKPQKE